MSTETKTEAELIADERRLEEIQERWTKAGTGWKIVDSAPADGRSPEWILIEGPRGFQDEMGTATTDIAMSHRGDAEAIAHAPEDIAFLLAEIERRQKVYDAAMQLFSTPMYGNLPIITEDSPLFRACREARGAK